MTTTAPTDSLAGLVGVRYLERGTDPAVGLDCYGLVREALARLGVGLPERPAECLAETLADRLPSGAACRRGDVLDAVDCRGQRHLLVAIDAFRALHAAPATGVVEVRVAGWRRARMIRAVLRPRGMTA